MQDSTEKGTIELRIRRYGETHCLAVTAEDTIFEVKKKLMEKSGASTYQVVLRDPNIEYQDHHTVHHYKLAYQALLHALPRYRKEPRFGQWWYDVPQRLDGTLEEFQREVVKALQSDAVSKGDKRFAFLLGTRKEEDKEVFVMYVGMKGPQDSIFEGGTILFEASIISVGLAFRVLTPMYHPYTFCPIGTLFAELGIPSLLEKYSDSSEGWSAIEKGEGLPPWGAVFKHSFSPDETTTEPGQLPTLFDELNGFYSLLASPSHWVLPRSADIVSAIPLWERWNTQPEIEKEKATALAGIYVKGEWRPEWHAVCEAEFKREVKEWLLVCARVWRTTKLLLPRELQHVVIQHLSLLHHPVVTIDEFGHLQGIDAVLSRFKAEHALVTDRWAYHEFEWTC